MKKYILILLLLISLPAFAADKESAYERVIRTGVLRCGYMLWPPYFEMDANTKMMSGLGADLYREMAKLLDIKIEYTEIVIGQQVEDLKSGRIDAVCNDGPYVFSAMKFVDYSKPAYYSPVYLYVRASDNRFVKATDINDGQYSIMGIDGDLTLGLAERNYPKTKRISMPAVTDAATLMLNVADGKSDATIIDPYAANSFNKNNPGKKLKILGEAVAIYPVGLSVMKGEQELLNMLDAAMDALWNTNTAMPLLLKYDPSGTAFLPAAKPYEISK